MIWTHVRLVTGGNRTLPDDVRSRDDESSHMRRARTEEWSQIGLDKIRDGSRAEQDKRGLVGGSTGHGGENGYDPTGLASRHKNGGVDQKSGTVIGNQEERCYCLDN
jgi:hypothetical protein